jgi:D-tyrosyl-tRNA(Tyr) deacylase
VLAVSNFTVYGDTSRNRRPSFFQSAGYDRGKELFDLFVEELRKLGCKVETGVYGADMEVTAVMDGPVTVLVEVRDGKPK